MGAGTVKRRAIGGLVRGVALTSLARRFGHFESAGSPVIEGRRGKNGVDGSGLTTISQGALQLIEPFRPVTDVTLTGTVP